VENVWSKKDNKNIPQNPIQTDEWHKRFISWGWDNFTQPSLFCSFSMVHLS
jgi:hypothetical protein